MDVIILKNAMETEIVLDFNANVLTDLWGGIVN